MFDIRTQLPYTRKVQIVSVRHKGLKRFIEKDDKSGISSFNAIRIRNIITALIASNDINELLSQSLPGWNIHPLKGKEEGKWSITVTGNWRMVFKIVNNEIHDLNLEDYH